MTDIPTFAEEERSLIDFHATLARKKQQMLEAVAFQMNEQAKAKLAKMEDMEQMAKVELSSTAEEPSLPLPTRSPRDPSPSKTVKHVDSSPTKPIRSPIKSTVQPKLLDGMAKREQERQLRREEVQRRKEEKRLQQEVWSVAWVSSL